MRHVYEFTGLIERLCLTVLISYILGINSFNKRSIKDQEKLAAKSVSKDTVLRCLLP